MLDVNDFFNLKVVKTKKTHHICKYTEEHIYKDVLTNQKVEIKKDSKIEDFIDYCTEEELLLFIDEIEQKEKEFIKLKKESIMQNKKPTV